MNIGANYSGGGECEFVLWVPRAGRVSLRLESPGERDIPLKKTRHGYWRVRAENFGWYERIQSPAGDR